ncbi:MAG: DUF1080 domain-containing protein [Isosphaeraceae bacterium]|nr:DUF1080 domain-containing protein [Isosphaeraceae bacterium]
MPARAALAVALSGLFAVVVATGAEQGFTPLVSGDSPDQFQLVGIGPDAIKVVDGEVELSGKPNGYFATKGTYKNYVLQFDWMYDRPEGLVSDAKFAGNSGLLIHITGKPKVWPKCTEVQLANSDAGNIFAIQGAKFQGKKDPAAQRKAVKPVGQWNVEEVTCRDGAIACKINGIEVASGIGADPDSGAIGWQSEGTKIHLRKIRIKVLD